MKHASLFTGIGGFDLAAEWMGWQNIFQVEIDPFCQMVLSKMFPNAKRYENIKAFSGKKYRGTIDVLTGGFPCQPYSSAGKRKGTADERHLWPEMLRVIREVRPRYIVGENVYGLVTWNDGLVFQQVQSDLESEGYEVQPYVLPACGINAPHRRNRVWFVAHADSNAGRWQEIDKRNEHQQEGQELWAILKSNGYERPASNSHSERQQIQRRDAAKQEKGNRPAPVAEYNTPGDWNNWPTQSPVCFGNDGLSSRLDGISFPKWRNNSIKAAGNAIVPPLALQIFKAIQLFDDGLTRS